MADIAHRFAENPILRPADIRPSIDWHAGRMLAESRCFPLRRQDLAAAARCRAAQNRRPARSRSRFSTPAGKLEILEFDIDDPRLNRDDPRVIRFDGRDYSHDDVASSTGFEPRWHSLPRGAIDARPIHGMGELETYGIEDCRVTQIGEHLLSDIYAGVGARRRRRHAQHHRLAKLFAATA